MIENTSSGEENEEVIINPYNFNNQLISQNDVEKILMSFDIDLCINDITLYQKAFIHKSYTKKDMEKFGASFSKMKRMLEKMNQPAVNAYKKTIKQKYL